MKKILQLLWKMRELGAGRMHLREGYPPMIRVDGRLIAIDRPVLGGNELDAVLREICIPARMEECLSEGHSAFMIRTEEGRFRVVLYRTTSGMALVFHELGSELPSFEDLGLPESLLEFTALSSGLLLFSGPIGCGKTTTLHSLIARIQKERPLHVITIECPIEFHHEEGAGLIQQFEVGMHFRTFAEGVAMTERIRPDLLVVGDVRNAETLEGMLRAAESGVLVLASLHAGSSIQALSKLEELFPPCSREAVRQRLAGSLRAVLCQVLVPKLYGRGELPAVEVLTCTEGVCERIRSGEFEGIGVLMEEGRGLGMATLDDALFDLVARNLTGLDEALTFAMDKSRFEACRRASPVL